MRIQLKAIRTNVSRNITMVTNMITKDLELAKSVLDFIPLSPFSDWGTKIVLDLEVVEEEGPKEIAYPKPILLELGFGALNPSSSFALDILSI